MIAQPSEYTQQVDLAKAALDATTAAAQNIPQNTTSNAISNTAFKENYKDSGSHQPIN